MQSLSIHTARAASRLRLAGAVLIIAALGWFVLETIAIAHFPHYSYLRNYISDLGVPDPGLFQGRAIDSPLSWLANLMFVTQGLALLAAAVLVARHAMAGAVRWLLPLLAAGYATGYVLIAAFHGSETALADGTFALHVLGGSLAVVFGYLAIIVAALSARRLGGSAGYRNISLALCALGIASLATLVATSATATGAVVASSPLDGLWERGGCYAIILWELVTGWALLARGRSHAAG